MPIKNKYYLIETKYIKTISGTCLKPEFRKEAENILEELENIISDMFLNIRGIKKENDTHLPKHLVVKKTKIDEKEYLLDPITGVIIGQEFYSNSGICLTKKSVEWEHGYDYIYPIYETKQSYANKVLREWKVKEKKNAWVDFIEKSKIDFIINTSLKLPEEENNIGCGNYINTKFYKIPLGNIKRGPDEYTNSNYNKEITYNGTISFRKDLYSFYPVNYTKKPDDKVPFKGAPNYLVVKNVSDTDDVFCDLITGKIIVRNHNYTKGNGLFIYDYANGPDSEFVQPIKYEEAKEILEL